MNLQGSKEAKNMRNYGKWGISSYNFSQKPAFLISLFNSLLETEHLYNYYCISSLKATNVKNYDTQTHSSWKETHMPHG